MQYPYTSGIGLDGRGVAVDAGHHITPQSQHGSCLPGAQSEQLKFPFDRPIYENFSLVYINSFPEQALGASNQDTRNVFIV